jgi:hypothetical protein
LFESKTSLTAAGSCIVIRRVGNRAIINAYKQQRKTSGSSALVKDYVCRPCLFFFPVSQTKMIDPLRCDMPFKSLIIKSLKPN